MSRFTIDNVIKTLFPYDSQNNNPYDEEILILEDHLKNISDNKKKIDYLNYFLEKNESKRLNDLISFYISCERIESFKRLSDEDLKSFIDKIQKDKTEGDGLISFITRITKEDDYSGYRNFFIKYILIYERILYDIENNTPAPDSKKKNNVEPCKEIIPLFKKINWIAGDDLLRTHLEKLKEINFIDYGNDSIDKVMSGDETAVFIKHRKYKSIEENALSLFQFWNNEKFIEGFITTEDRKGIKEDHWNYDFIIETFTKGKVFKRGNLKTSKDRMINQKSENRIYNYFKSILTA